MHVPVMRDFFRTNGPTDERTDKPILGVGSNRRIRELTEGGGLREKPFLFAFVFVLAFKHVFALDVQKR